MTDINAFILTLQEQKKDLNDEWVVLSKALAKVELTPVEKLSCIGARMACRKITNLSVMLKKKAKKLEKNIP